MSTPTGDERHPETPSNLDPDGFDEALGRIIKVIRTDLGIERGDLADRAGISYSYLAAIENGQRRPSSVVLRSIAEALGLRTHHLVESAEARADGTSPNRQNWSAPKPASFDTTLAFRQMSMPPPPAIDVVEMIDRLSPEDQALVRDLVMRLLRESSVNRGR